MKPGKEANAWRREYTKKNPAKRMLYSAKRRATIKNLPFNITEQDILELIPSHCPYTGISLITQTTRGSPRMSTLSLDRIIPELGYVKGNIQVISHLANSMKSNATREQLVRFARKILDEEDTSSRCRVNNKG